MISLPFDHLHRDGRGVDFITDDLTAAHLNDAVSHSSDSSVVSNDDDGFSGTAAGVLFGKLMCIATKGKVNPLIGSAGVSAVPMAARVSQKVGAEADPTNFLLMHAMGPNVAGVIGTAVAAGTFMAVFGVF